MNCAHRREGDGMGRRDDMRRCTRRGGRHSWRPIGVKLRMVEFNR